MTTKFKRTVESADEYKEIRDAAETLGFEPINFSLNGSWRAEGEPFFGKSVDEFEKVGQKYFYVRETYEGYTRELWRLEPDEGTGSLKDGSLTVTFRD